MQPWQGNRSPNQVNAINEKRNFPFFLMHNPMSWEFIDGKWYPVLSKLSEEPGVNGVHQTPYGSDSSEARLHFQDKGFTVLDYKSLEYLTRYPTTDGGWLYCLVWSHPKTLGSKVFWKLDHEGYNAFREALVKENIVDYPDPDVLEMHIDSFRRRIERHAKNQHIPEVKRKIEQMYKTIDAMRASLSPPAKKKGKKHA